METGIIGLPQVGKTSLFRILTRARVEARAGQPGETHVGVAQVPDARVNQLAELFHPKKITFATIQYVDVGGIQKDRAKDSASLVPLREADALAHVVRVFENPAVPHPAGSIDAMRDIESIDIELILNDLEQADRRIERVQKDLKKKKETILELELALLLVLELLLQAAAAASVAVVMRTSETGRNARLAPLPCLVEIISLPRWKAGQPGRSRWPR